MFTAEQQKAHRLQLADHLEQNVTDEQYAHSYYWDISDSTGCALGHAANAGIAGMILDNNDDPSFDGMSPTESGDVVFGVGAYDAVFTTYANDSGRAEAIEKLRNFA